MKYGSIVSCKKKTKRKREKVMFEEIMFKGFPEFKKNTDQNFRFTVFLES